jgi:hypothetical protein
MAEEDGEEDDDVEDEPLTFRLRPEVREFTPTGPPFGPI